MIPQRKTCLDVANFLGKSFDFQNMKMLMNLRIY